MENATGFRLSPQQQQVWLNQGSGVYFSQCAVKIGGPLDARAMRAACERLVGKHEILRTTFHRQAGLVWPLQVIHDHLPPVWTESVSSDLQADISSWLVAERNQPIDLDQGPLVRFALLNASEIDRVLIVTLPTLCGDARTLQLVIANLCADLVGSNDASDDVIQYADYSEWRNELVSGSEDDAKAGQEFWQEQNAQVMPTLAIPFRRTPAAGTILASDKVSRSVSSEIHERIRAAAAQCDVSTSVLLFATWQTYLWRITGQPEITLRYWADGRGQAEVQSAFGLFALPISVHCHLEDVSFADLMRRVNESLAVAQRWQDYCPAQDNATSMYNGIGFEWRNGVPTLNAEFAVCRLEYAMESQALRLCCAWDESTLEFHYDTRQFDRAVIERIADQFEQMLLDVARDSNAQAGSLNILPKSERDQILVDFNRTSADYPRDRCIHQLFEAQVERTPDRLALKCDEKQWTYRELNARANQLSHLLRNRGVRSGAQVGLCMDRSGESIIGLLAILKAGGAYVPLQPEQPKARLEYQLKETRSPAVITQESLLSVLPDYGGANICLNRDGAELDRQPTENPGHGGTADDLVYVIYTSGSTGVPKGVAVRHRNLVNYSYFMCGRLSAGDGLQFATVSTLNADLGNTCVFPSLISGGCLHVIPYEMAMDGTRVAAYGTKNPIDVLKITPSHLQALLASADGADVLPRKFLVLGGESSSWDLMEQVKAKGRCKVINHYGPTETTVGSLTFDYDDGQNCKELAKTVPVGRPIANTQVYVLNAHRQPVPVGVAGELFIGGDGVAQGYLNNVQQTKERFVPNPFAENTDARMYRTGDQVRYLPDGNIEFLGRLDNQVKIRGFRVEPSEVEAVISRYSDVLQSVVLAREDKTSGLCLIAYVVPTNTRLFAVEKLRSFLQEQLPHYMIPSAFVPLDAIPLTANGKIDRLALLDPGSARSAIQRERVAARNPTEEALAGIWAKVLDLDQIGVEDDFFELGGHSLLATQVVSRVRGSLGVDMPVRCIFEEPTVAGLAKVVSELREKANPTADVSQMLEELEGMSEEEVQRLLAMELQEGA